ncbi:DNA mismatch repair protein [Coemansia aciculifera]|nr:DNA mismatch repair protein [Coemansia aciculifera]
MALQRLSEDTASQIRSAAAIPDICELATALLDNSLANMSNIGLVEVISRHAKSGPARRCAIKNERQLYCEDCDPATLAGYNTVVKVRDIFEAYPVRRKVIDGSAKRLLDDIKAQLQIRSLGHPRITLQLVAKPGDTVIFAYASAPSLNQRMLQIFGPAVALSMEALSLDYDGCSLMGSFSKAPMLYRIQHIFIDGHLVDPPELLIIARTAFAASNYATKSNAAIEMESMTRLRTRHPIFILMIRSSGTAEQTLTAAPRGCFVVTDQLKRLVALACIKFLRKLHMMSDSQMRGALAASASSPQPKRQFELLQDSHDYGDVLALAAPTSKRTAHGSTSSARSLPFPDSNRRFPIRQSSRQPLSVLRVEHSERDSHYSEDERSICPIPFAGIGPTQLELFQGSSSDNIHEGLDVASLRVVGQADKKFIICQTDGWLVAIDQHAADERIRLEEHYDSLNNALHQCTRLPPNCSPSVIDGISILVPPVPVLLTDHDTDVILGMSECFKRLGIQIATATSSLAVDESSSSLFIICAPTTLLPRLRDGSERADLFAKELLLAIAGWYASSRHTHAEPPLLKAAAPCGHTESDSSSGWPALVDLPGIILETLKSIACRGAVKFGDPLSAAECQSIVARLARCQFPEFCAHGR